MGAALWFGFGLLILSLIYSPLRQVHVYWAGQGECVRIGCRVRWVVPPHDFREALLAGSSHDQHFVLCHCHDSKRLRHCTGKWDVDCCQVVGYSWYNTHPTSLSTFPHWGVDLAIVGRPNVSAVGLDF